MNDWDEQLHSAWSTQVDAIRERFNNGKKLTDAEIRRLFAEIDSLRVERDLAWNRDQERIDNLAGQPHETENPTLVQDSGGYTLSFSDGCWKGYNAGGHEVAASKSEDHDPAAHHDAVKKS